MPHYPVFNLADSAIVCGGILAVVLAARGLQLDGTRLADKDGSGEPAETGEGSGDEAAPDGAGGAAPADAPEEKG